MRFSPGCHCCSDPCEPNLLVKVYHNVCEPCCVDTTKQYIDAWVLVRDNTSNVVGGGTAASELGIQVALPGKGTYSVQVGVDGCSKTQEITFEDCEDQELEIYLCCARTCYEIRDYDTGELLETVCQDIENGTTDTYTGPCPQGCPNISREGYWQGCALLPSECFNYDYLAPTVYLYSKENWVRICDLDNCEDVTCSGCWDNSLRRCDMLPRVLNVVFTGPAEIFGDYSGVPIELTYDLATIGAEPCESFFNFSTKCRHRWTACLDSPGGWVYCNRTNGLLPPNCFSREFGSAKVTLSILSTAAGGVCQQYALLTWENFLGSDCTQTNSTFFCGGDFINNPYVTLAPWWCPDDECNPCTCADESCDCEGGCYDDGVRNYPSSVSKNLGCPFSGCGSTGQSIVGPVDIEGNIVIPHTSHPCCPTPPEITYALYE